jgi:hypothetical protein
MASINATTSSGIVATADNTGTLQLQSAGTTIANVTSTGLAVTGALTTNGIVSSPYAMKNRIINGDMQISQRNGTTATTITNGSDFFGPDRWKYYRDVGGTFTTTQSSIAPAGFSNSMLTTASTGASPSAAQLNFFQQIIEGFNVADLGWGTANAQTVTLSFWVRSSIPGTYSIAISNNALNRAYVATYTISAADTWERETITIPGDTTGTWLNNNGVGIRVYWDLGSGSNYNLTAGTWGGTWGLRTSGSVTWGATTGATFYLTGVQLEQGSTATSYEWLPIGTELALCQRYFQRLGSAVGMASASNFITAAIQFFVPMRTTPTVSTSNLMTVTDTNAIDATQSSTGIAIVSGNRANNLGMNFTLTNLSGLTVSKLFITVPTAYSDGVVLVSAEL